MTQPTPTTGRTSLASRMAAAACALLLALAAPLQEAGLGLPAFAEDKLNMEELMTVSLFERNTPGVVYITTEQIEIETTRDMSMRMELVPRGSGSGWVFDNEGHIITNFHVIQSAQAVTVKFIDGTTVPARVVGADPGSDVAVLQVELPAKSRDILRPLARGDSAAIRVGQQVFAIGNPFGLDHTLTKGIVSGVGRTITSIGGRPIQGAIQTDASINPGNSGGPLLNSAGKVIGMNTVIISPTGASAGVGFAIPSDTVVARAAQILRYGYVKRPNLGIYLGQDGLAQRFSGQEGAIIAGLQRGSPAMEAGIKAGDILVQIDERPIRRGNDVYAELDEHQPGEFITARLLRPESEELGVVEGGKYSELSLRVQLAEAPAQ